MKKIIFISIFFSNFLSAQVNNIKLDCTEKYPHPVSLDNTGTEKTKSCQQYVQHGQTVSFTIENINRQLYDVSVNGNVIIYTSDTPPSLKTFSGMDGQSTADESKVPDGAMGAAKTLTDEVNANIKLVNDYIKKYESFKTAVGNLENAKTIYAELQALSQTSIDAGTNKVGDLIKRCSDVITTFTGSDKTIITHIDALKSIVKKAKEEEDEAYSKVPQDATDAEKIDKIIESLQKEKKEQAAVFAGVTKLKGQDKTAVKRANDLHKIAGDVMKQVNDYDYGDLENKLQKLYATVISPENYSLSSAPIQADGDEIKFVYKITPKADLKLNTASQPIPETPYTIWTRGGLQLKFATGIGLNTSSLLNESYSVVPSDSIPSPETGKKVQAVEIKKDKQTDWFVPNGVAYAHFLTRLGKYYSLGGFVGVNVDFKNIQSSGFNIGITNVLGNKYSVALTAGLGFSNVNVLNGKYQVDTKTNVSQVDASALTKSSFRCGIFFGVSLNLASTELKK